MSGGSFQYLYSKIEDAAQTLSADQNPTRKAFGKHLYLIAEAMHDIEWVDSCDYGPGDEMNAIMKCIDKQDILLCLIEDGKNIIKEINELIKD